MTVRRIALMIKGSMLVIAATVLAACGGGSGGAAQVSVPNVVGDTQAAATTAVTGAGLTVGAVTQASSATVASGNVIGETPAAGTSAASGSSVALVVSTGLATVSVPNVVGDTQAAATTAITGAGLVVGTVTMQSSTTVASGSVISENPGASATVAGGSAVSLVVSSGPPPVNVPNVVGDTQAAASTAITGAGLVVGTVTMQSSTTVASGSVISENPLAGATVAGSSAVNLVVSSGAVLAGVVASGYPVANGPGYALDAVTGTQLPFTTDAGGNYSVNVFGYTGPFLLHVLGVTSGGSPVNIYSLAAASSAGTTVNVTPLSNVVLAYAAGVTTQNLEAACTANQAGCPALLNGILTSLSAANASVIAAIPANVFTAFGLTAGTFNAITTQFATTHTGVDGLLDALSVVPPVTAGGTYTVSLVGSTNTVLATVPLSGTAGTQGGAPVAGTTPTASAISQASNLAAVEGEIQTFFTNFSALFATADPTIAQITPYINSSFLLSGINAATFISAAAAGNAVSIGTVITGGGLAPYSGASYALGGKPGPSVTFDANNCVTSIWVLSPIATAGFELFDAVPSSNAAGVCTGGTWTIAGNQRNYDQSFRGLFQKGLSAIKSGTATYSQTFQMGFDTSESTGNVNAPGTPYASVLVTGPGLATVGNPTALSGSVAIIAPVPPTAPAVLQNQSSINDPYYGGVNGGTSLLVSCASITSGSNPNYTSATPCFNSNVAAGSDYAIAFYGASNNLLELDEDRINITLSSVTVPSSWYPTINSVTPSSSVSIPAGSISTVTTTWTLLAGATNDNQGLSLYDSGGTLIFYFENDHVAATATTNAITVSGLTAAPTSGSVAILTLIGGLSVGTHAQF
jgi:beta-lactam-binding protein with PASTA domain